jgi:predicted nucleic acid-binding protein
MDTSGFLALWDAGDSLHGTALAPQRELVARGRRFLTTDYVADETATLLLLRHSHKAAADFLKSVEHSTALRIEWVGSEGFFAGASLFERHADKQWSFTDCVSFSLMREMLVREAFTADHHFDQAGFVAVLRKPEA